MTGSPPLEIDVHSLARQRVDGLAPVIVDVREPWEREICAFDGALTIPMGELPGRWEEVPAGEPVVVVCHHGVRSLHATVWLRHQGVAGAVSLRGGIDAWAREIDPAMACY